MSDAAGTPYWRGDDHAAFISTLGALFEHSPWIAERALEAAPFASAADAFEIMSAAVRAATDAEQLALLRAHPDLAGKAAIAGDLTVSSSLEQAGAGLDRLTPPEMERFTALNARYTASFGFPFIIAVAGLDKHDILAAFESRIDGTPAAERKVALEQVLRIARVRLDRLLGSDR